MNQPRPLIAVLDDEPKMCKALSRLLHTRGFEVVTFALAEELLALCALRLPDCLVLDLHLPGISGFEVLERLTAQRSSLPVIVITGHDQPGNAQRVRELGAADYLLKPVNELTLVAALAKAMQPGGAAAAS